MHFYSWILNKADFFLQASVIHHVYARDDFAGAKVTIMDLSESKGKGGRKGDVYQFDESNVISEEDLYQRFETLLNTWDYVRDNVPPDSSSDGVDKTI